MGQVLSEPTLVERRHSLIENEARDNQKREQEYQKNTIKYFTTHIESDLIDRGSISINKEGEERCFLKGYGDNGWVDGGFIKHYVSQQEFKQLLSKQTFEGVKVDETPEKIILSIE